MKDIKKLTRVIVPHSDNCFSQFRSNPWSGILDKDKPTMYGNAYANDQDDKGTHLWYRMTCNDPKCPAIKAVHSSILRNA